MASMVKNDEKIWCWEGMEVMPQYEEDDYGIEEEEDNDVDGDLVMEAVMVKILLKETSFCQDSIPHFAKISSFECPPSPFTYRER